MAYTVVPTKPDSDGKKLTLINWNAHIKANIDYLKAVLAGTDADKIPNAALAVLATEAWTDFTPLLYQASAVAAAIGEARYKKFGRLALVRIYLSASAAGTASNPIMVVSLPAALDAHIATDIGSFSYLPAAGVYSVGFVRMVSAGQLRFYRAGDSLGSPLGQASPTIANGAELIMELAYETAT